MGSGYRDFTAGQTLTSDQVDGYLMRQTVMTFASSTARDTDLAGVLDEGMFAYLEDTNSLTYYDGGGWEYVMSNTVTWTVSNVTQSGSVACTTNRGWIQYSNKTFIAKLVLTFNGAGTVANDITIATPTTLADALDIGGSFVYLDQGTGYYTGVPFTSSGTGTFKLASHGANTLLGQTFAIASTDTLSLTLFGRY